MARWTFESQYYIYAIVTEDDADFDENTDEDDVIYGDVIRVDAANKRICL